MLYLSLLPMSLRALYVLAVNYRELLIGLCLASESVPVRTVVRRLGFLVVVKCAETETAGLGSLWRGRTSIDEADLPILVRRQDELEGGA